VVWSSGLQEYDAASLVIRISTFRGNVVPSYWRV